jgi:hypothetical protein
MFSTVGADEGLPVVVPNTGFCERITGWTDGIDIEIGDIEDCCIEGDCVVVTSCGWATDGKNEIISTEGFDVTKAPKGTLLTMQVGLLVRKGRFITFDMVGFWEGLSKGEIVGEVIGGMETEGWIKVQLLVG